MATNSAAQTKVLADVTARDLIGMSGNELQNRLFIEKYWQTQIGDGRVRNFGGVRFSTERLNLVTVIVPDKAQKYATLVGDAQIVASCVTQNKADDSYGLYLGVLSVDLATEEMIARGKAGEYTEIMDRNTPCRSWGPILPLSAMR